jgi:hypothetical protein
LFVIAPSFLMLVISSNLLSWLLAKVNLLCNFWV